MVLSIRAAERSPARSVEDRAADIAVPSGLSELQRHLQDDLALVEAALIESTSHGERPGRDAGQHLVAGGGKRVRPVALLLSCACFGKITAVAREAALVSELVHTATLLHDDVIDDGTERRGARTPRMIWGNAVSVLAGDLLLVDALERIGRQAPAVLPSLFATLRALVDGEILQLRGRVELDASRDTYHRVLRGKTASLFRWSTGTGALLGGASDADQERLGTVGELVGMAFQLVDDSLDYSNQISDKTALADLREGKMTLPLVLAIERTPDLLECVDRVRRGDDASLAEVRQRVLESGACEEVRRLADAKSARALDILSLAPKSEARSLLEDVVSKLSERSA